MTMEARTSEYKAGDWLTQCAFHPFTIWASESWIDAEGKIRCQKFCGQYEGPRTLKEHSAILAQAHTQHEAPAPPRTVPRPQAKDFLGSWARWRMQDTVTRLEDATAVHDGLPSPAAATLVDGRLGSKAFRFNAAQGYEILNSADANTTTETKMAVAAWVKIDATQVGNGRFLSKFPIGGFQFRANPAGAGTLQLLYGSGSVSYFAFATSVGDWHHLAADYDGDKLRLYIDAVQVAISAGGITPVGNQAPLKVGQSFKGDMYDLRYLMHSFATGEVAWIMAGNS